MPFAASGYAVSAGRLEPVGTDEPPGIAVTWERTGTVASSLDVDCLIHPRGTSVIKSSATNGHVNQNQGERSLQLALAAAQVALENRAEDVVVLDMRKLSQLFDYFVICTGRSRRQLHAISEEIDRHLEEELNDRRLGIEGYDASRWILLDYGTVVVHIFDPETREYYALEELWAEAPRVSLDSLQGKSAAQG